MITDSARFLSESLCGKFRSGQAAISLGSNTIDPDMDKDWAIGISGCCHCSQTECHGGPVAGKHFTSESNETIALIDSTTAGESFTKRSLRLAFVKGDSNGTIRQQQTLDLFNAFTNASPFEKRTPLLVNSTPPAVVNNVFEETAISFKCGLFALGPFSCNTAKRHPANANNTTAKQEVFGNQRGMRCFVL